MEEAAKQSAIDASSQTTMETVDPLVPESTTQFSVLESLLAAGEAARKQAAEAVEKAAQDSLPQVSSNPNNDTPKVIDSKSRGDEEVKDLEPMQNRDREPKTRNFESEPVASPSENSTASSVLEKFITLTNLKPENKVPENVVSSITDNGENIAITNKTLHLNSDSNMNIGNPSNNVDTMIPTMGSPSHGSNNTNEYDYYEYKSNDAVNTENIETTTEDVNPFLLDDYDWYAYNDVPEGEEYVEYTDYDREKKRNETLALFENIGKAPPIRDVLYVARDLDPNFLVLPPLVAMALLALAFVPCVILKWRDDIREMMGKPRVYGPRTRRYRKSITDVEADLSHCGSVAGTSTTRGASPSSAATRSSPLAPSTPRENIHIRTLNATDLRSGEMSLAHEGDKASTQHGPARKNSTETDDSGRKTGSSEDVSMAGSSSADTASGPSSRAGSGNSQNGGRGKRVLSASEARTNYAFEETESRGPKPAL